MITQDPLKRSILTDGLILEVGGLLCKEDYLVMEKGGFLLPVFPREARGSTYGTIGFITNSSVWYQLKRSPVFHFRIPTATTTEKPPAQARSCS